MSFDIGLFLPFLHDADARVPVQPGLVYAAAFVARRPNLGFSGLASVFEQRLSGGVRMVISVAQRKRLGDILQERGLLSEEQLKQALEVQRESGEKLGEVLVSRGIISADAIADALSDHLRVPRADFSRRYVSPQVVNLVPEELLKRHEIIPVDIEDDQLIVAMTDPLNIMIIDEIQRVVGLAVRPLIATADEINDAFMRTRDISSSARQVFDEYADDTDGDGDLAMEEMLGDAPGVRLANMILQQAVRETASDIHFEPREEDLRVRFRVDGLLRDVMVVPKRLRSDVVSRIKIMSGLDITERRRPQDGRIQMEIEGTEVDMRISSLPTLHGEKIVARVLNKAAGLLGIGDFGFSLRSLDLIQSMLQQSQGLILVTGPTGSGKTTSLYAFLSEVNTSARNIITVEDPVEYRLEGITQVQVNAKVDLTFASGLRTVLRQDPDVIMVGEIRDRETAEIAVRSALTGHLVFSTLHTNSAVASITRLLDMGVEPFLISSTVIGIIAQRLVRRVCRDCRQLVPLTDPLAIRLIESLGMPVPETVYEGQGCPVCKDTGYRGRAAIEEVVRLNRELREAIDRRASEGELTDMALRRGMVTLQKNAVQKMLDGVTTPAEVIRTVYSVDSLDEELKPLESTR